MSTKSGWRKSFVWLVLGFVSVSAQGTQGDTGTLSVADSVPEGNGQLETAPKLFKGGVDREGREFLLNGQPARGGKLILTASNGFFDNGTCRASGESSLPKVGDEDLIKPNFAMLDQWKRTDGTLRWHLWLAKPGEVHFSVNMRISKAAAGSQIKVTFAGESRTVTTTESSPDRPQPWKLTFRAAEAGEHMITISASHIAAPQTGVGELHSIDVFGPAVSGAQLLRARWRPAAVHGGYSCSTLGQSRIWVMTTRSVCDFSSYSPITTPFGYYGTSFDSDRRVKGGFNFSMWAARAGGVAPPLKQMPHLLAAGSPDAEFSGFGHEGSGVKLRGWIPMPDRPEVCIQALRVNSEGNYDTYSGYFWDHPRHQWRLYAVGRKWNGGKVREHLSPGSFCEIPGPPHVQRSGDRVREVRRRGWHSGEDGKWYAMDSFDCRSKGPANKSWYTTRDGEFAMGTGGMRYYRFEQPAKPDQQESLPEFLSKHSTAQLFQLPADIRTWQPSRVGKTTATINVVMKRAGRNAKATVYYGEVDCLTFAPRSLHGTERNSQVSQSTQAADRSWSHSHQINSLHNGSNSVTLTGLKPGSTYYCRILITNSEGKMWTFNTESFETR